MVGITSESGPGWDDLLAGDGQKPVTRDGVLTGDNLTRGALLGRVTADGKYKQSDDGAGDGSETPVAILAIDADASSEDQAVIVYVAGEFNENKVGFGTGKTADGVRNDLDALGIYLKPAVPA